MPNCWLNTLPQVAAYRLLSQLLSTTLDLGRNNPPHSGCGQGAAAALDQYPGHMQRGNAMPNLSQWAATALIGAAGLFAQPAAAADDTVRLGYSELLSGTFAQVGDQGIKTIQTVIDGINAKGGVLGKKIALVALDNK